MKKFFIALIGLFISLSTFAGWSVTSLVVQADKDDEGKYCCFHMLHLYYLDGEFIGYGTSNAGYMGRNCCPSQSGNVDLTGFPAQHLEAVEEFNSTPEFQESVTVAIIEYLAENENQMGRIEINKDGMSGNTTLSFEASEEGAYFLVITSILTGEKFVKRVLVNSGLNQISVDYDWNDGFEYPQEFLIKIVSKDEGFKAVLKI